MKQNTSHIWLHKLGLYETADIRFGLYHVEFGIYETADIRFGLYHVKFGI